MAALLLLNGPNLNLLGRREPGLYGSQTLSAIEGDLVEEAGRLGHTLEVFQSNAEHKLVERVHQAGSRGTEFIIINPAAYTHTSIALRDAFLGVGIPFIEIHISNVFAREAFRHRSYLSDIAVGVISGLGTHGYRAALQAAHEQLQSQPG